MDVFKREIEILKYFGIERFPLNRLFGLLKIYNYIFPYYCILIMYFYILGTKDIVDIAESMAHCATLSFVVIKFALFNKRADELYGLMDEIEKLNKDCKEKYFKLLNCVIKNNLI